MLQCVKPVAALRRPPRTGPDLCMFEADASAELRRAQLQNPPGHD